MSTTAAADLTTTEELVGVNLDSAAVHKLVEEALQHDEDGVMNTNNHLIVAGSTVAATAASATSAPPPPAASVPSKRPAIEYPRPNDVLLPADGYQLWPGNARFLTLIETHQTEFAHAPSRSDQALLAAHILQTIHRDGGRFLTAIEVPMQTAAMAAQKSIVRTSAWDLMKDADVLAELALYLGTSTQMDEQKRLARKEKKMRRRERKRRRRERRRERRRQREHMEGNNGQETVPPSAMGALQCLYYVPSYYPSATDHIKTGLECESESLSSSSSSSSEEEDDEPEVEVAPPMTFPSKKKARVSRKPMNSRSLLPTTTGAGTASTPVATPASHTSLINMKGPPEAGKGHTDTSSAPGSQVNFHYKPKPNKSLKAAVNNEGEMALPKGVTVRPSGKWQAQTYFAGQSRYVGVYDTSRLAAKAYVVVQDYLRQYRHSNSISKDSPKEDLAGIFANARKAADDAVRELLVAEGGPSAAAALKYNAISLKMPETSPPSTTAAAAAAAADGTTTTNAAAASGVSTPTATSTSATKPAASASASTKDAPKGGQAPGEAPLKTEQEEVESMAI